MYFNDIHILGYVVIAAFGLIVGKLIAWSNIRLPEKKKIFSRDFFEENKKGIYCNYIFMIITAIMYVILLYKFGIKKDELLKNLDLIKYIFLIPMLILAFSIDIKNRIIPNRLNLTIFEIGLLFTFIYGITNVNMAKDYILGMFAGVAIFGIITLLGKLISGKEAMGLGDVKFIGALGLYFGVNSIAEISLLSFIVATIISIFILFIRLLILKTKDEYIAFGPFIAISAIICIFLPSGVIFDKFLFMCKLISNQILMF